MPSGVKDIYILGLEHTPRGRRIAFKFLIPFKRSKEIFESLKGIDPDAIYYTGQNGIFHVTADNEVLYRKVRDTLAKEGIHVGYLDEFVQANNIFKSQTPIQSQYVKSQGILQDLSNPAEKPPEAKLADIKSVAQEPIAAKHIVVIGLDASPYGRRISFRFLVPFSKSKAAFDEAKTLGKLAINYTGERGIFQITAENESAFNKIKEIFTKHGINFSPLDEFVAKNNLFGKKPGEALPSAETQIGEKPARPSYLEQQLSALSYKDKEIELNDGPGNSMVIKIGHYRLNNESNRKRFLIELITYTFPENEKIKKQITNYYGEKQTITEGYKVRGNYKQYVLFGKLLRERFFNNDHDTPVLKLLRIIISRKLHDGRLQKDRYEGEYPRHPDEVGINRDNMHPKEIEELDSKRRQYFIDSIDKRFPNSKIELYSDQKDGIAFLYARDHALLGDETGAGKTAQMVGAAALRAEDFCGNRPIIIFVHKPEKQIDWAREIQTIVGDQEKTKISYDPLYPAKWTIVKYSSFEGDKDKEDARGKRIKASIEAIKNANFCIAIFDEIHKLKHGDTARSKNLFDALENIPTKWGASATISSNKPTDVRGQLMMIGHHLGHIDARKFAVEFGGEGGSQGRNLTADEKFERRVKAAERLNKWLNLTRVYVRRTKDEMRQSRGEKMPPLNIYEVKAQFNPSHFDSTFNSILSTYKTPYNPLSRLVAARKAIAEVKTDDTTRMVMNIVQNNMQNPNPAASKVVVFTNFVHHSEDITGKGDKNGAAYQLIKKISEGLKQIDPNFQVIAYLSDISKKDQATVKERFTNDPNIKVLVISMKMGGTGLDFPNVAQHMVVNDFDWTPESAEQSEGRLYRINTNHPVNIHYVLGRGIDSKLFEKVKQKRELAATVQRYRKIIEETQNENEENAALDKIYNIQKQISEIDKDMIQALNDEYGSGAAENFIGIEKSKSKKGRFSEYVDSYNLLADELCYGIFWS